MWDSAICYVFHIIAHMEALAVDFGERVRVGAFFFYVFIFLLSIQWNRVGGG